MATKVQPIPEGYHSITPYLSIKGASSAISFYKSAFGAKEIYRIEMPDGTLGHAELLIGDSKIMLSEENEQWGNLSPQSLGGSPVGICLYVENVDDVYNNALSEGASVIGDMQLKDQWYGDRTGSVLDPFGHKWTIMTHIEDISFEEMQRRSIEMFAEVKQS